jgi:tetratricopeptide (TPR) repeat protein
MADTPRIEELRRRVQLDPASIAFAALAEEYRKQGRYGEAIDTCTAGLQRHPAYLSAHVTLGRALIEVGRYDDAQEELEHVLRVAPENLAAIRGLADIHHRRGELPEVHAPFGEPPAQQAIPLKAPFSPPPEPLSPPPLAAVAVAREIPLSIPSALSEPKAPAPDPALAGLEGFLAAILTAREARASRR